MTLPIIEWVSEITGSSSNFILIASILFVAATLIHFSSDSDTTRVAPSKKIRRRDGTLPRDHIEQIALRRWNDVLIWITFSPEELSRLDKRKQTVLHHACLFQSPAQVIEMIVLQAPELVSMDNEDGELALHWAIRLSLSNQIIRILLAANPKSGVYAQDKDGNTPLSLLWERHQDDLLRLWWTGRSQLLASPFWTTITLLLRSSCSADDDWVTNHHNKCTLHTAARSPCPPSLFPLALQVYRNELPLRDAHGRTPLAVACSDFIANRCCDVLTKIEMILADPQSHPTVRMVDDQGRVPFHAALLAGVTWDEGLHKFFEIDSALISLTDPVSGLSPFMLAAVGSQLRCRNTTDNKFLQSDTVEEQIKSITTIFNLLRADPVQVLRSTAARRF